MIEVALCTDNNYAMPAGVMIYSVCRYTENVSFNVIVPNDFSAENKMRLKEITDAFSAEIKFMSISQKVVDGFPVGLDNQPAHVSIAAYYRLFLGRILPETVSKVIYLDCDLICLSSLEELWNIELDGAPLACVNDIPRPWQNPQERLGYDKSIPYFNSGVLLVDLDYWRRNNVTRAFYDFITSATKEQIEFHDQDTLNYVFHETALFLPPKFNATDVFFHKEFLDEKFPYSDAEVYDARYKPVIVHFTYKNKPWFLGGSHTYRDAFLTFKKATPWKNQRLKVKKATNLKGMVANILVLVGLYRYHDDYIPKKASD